MARRLLHRREPTRHAGRNPGAPKPANPEILRSDKPSNDRCGADRPFTVKRSPLCKEVPSLVHVSTLILVFLAGGAVGYALMQILSRPVIRWAHVPRRPSPATGSGPVGGRVVVPVCAHTPPELMDAVTNLYGSHPLTLVHVVQDGFVGPDAASVGRAAILEEEFRAHLHALEDRAAHVRTAPIDLKTLHGRSPGPTLLRWVQRTQPFLVVLSLRDDSCALSATALYVLRHAHSPVWVWHGPMGDGTA